MSNNGLLRSITASGALLTAAASVATVLSTLAAPAVRRGWAAVSAPHRAPERLVGDCVQLLSGVALSAVLLWLLLSALVCLSDLSRRRPAPPPGGAFRPRFMRALVALAIGSAVVTTTAGASADQGPGGARLPRALDGLPLPDRAYGVVHTHEVSAGDSLWRISADLVDEGPRTGVRAGVVARTWPRVYRLNRHRIGPDPDLLRPGTTLRLPAGATLTHLDTEPGAPR